jgi:hypothetical protein
MGTVVCCQMLSRENITRQAVTNLDMKIIPVKEN